MTGMSTIAPLTCALICTEWASMKASSVDSNRRACSHQIVPAMIRPTNRARRPATKYGCCPARARIDDLRFSGLDKLSPFNRRFSCLRRTLATGIAFLHPGHKPCGITGAPVGRQHDARLMGQSWNLIAKPAKR